MTSHLELRTTIHCPLGQAAKRLDQFMARHGSPSGDVLKLTLRIDPPLRVERSVIATIRATHRFGDMEPRYIIQWAPEKPGPFPLFSGELHVEGEDDYNTFVLVLAGKYDPPLGAVGAAFDSVIGKEIARATASNLLRDIRVFVESEFSADETHKRVLPKVHDGASLIKPLT